MDMKKIAQMIEERRVLTTFSAYPYIVEKNGEKLIIWFNYIMPESAEGIDVVVTEAFCASQEYEVKNIKFDMKKTIDVESLKEPEIEYPEYLEMLENLYSSFNEEGMKQLLSKTEIAYLTDVYNEIAYQLILSTGGI